MADFDSFNYDIESKLPEWWKGFGALEPVNKFTQQLIADILQGLLTSMGVVQPLNCWLTIPEEYNWYHHYKATDNYLEDENNLLIENAVTTLFNNNKIIAKLPNTKRNCHAKIKLKLSGKDVIRDDNGEIVVNLDERAYIRELKVQNAGQEIIFKNINPTSTIEIITETNEILVDGEDVSNLVEGKIEKIKPVIKNPDYKELYIDKHGQEQYQNIDIENENKKTEITLETTDTVNFDLEVYLKKPTYTTEQNIRIASVSAFPIEYVRLYGYFCHPFNNRSGYKFLWEKKYTKKSRTTYDRITKQYDCERFYIEVKFYGIGVPLYKGFPQDYGETDAKFLPNTNLDKWGKIYGLNRRSYKTDITEDEEPFTFPKYYSYPLEQDYWYEERITNEYKFDEYSINSVFIKDDEYNNIGFLECIYPFTNDIWVYTETINQTDNIIEEYKNIKCTIEENEEQNKRREGKSWENLIEFNTKPLIVELNPQSLDIRKTNNHSYKTKFLKCSFNLKPIEHELPKNIKITGIELKIETNSTIQSKTVKLDTDSTITIPYILKKKINEDDEEVADIVFEEHNIILSDDVWLEEKGYYTIGGKNNLFGEEEITKEQLFYGNDGKLDFKLGFINENNFLKSDLYIKNILLNLYYKPIKTDYDISVSFDKREINLKTDINRKINMTISVENKGIDVYDKEIIIVLPPELQIEMDNQGNSYNSFLFSLDIDEKFTIPNIPIIPTIFSGNTYRTGWYDILVLCDDKIIKNEILIRGGDI